MLSSSGNQYIFILYHYDTKSIHTHILKNWQALEITKSWITFHEHLQQNGTAPALHILDNECSSTMQKSFRKYNVNFQLVPPYTHRRNAPERAIRTLKNHLCAVLASCDPNFPSQEWDRLVSQEILTLNLLRSSCTNPSLSAHAAINGNFDFNTMPLAPPVTNVLIHESASNQPSL